MPILHTELYDDVVTRSRSDGRPWRPVSQEAPDAPYRMREVPENVAFFSIVELVESEPLAGDAVLWGIDLHQRSAHIGIGLRPSFRGRGLASDVVRTLCQYAFATRGLHRLAIETLADNAPMIAVAGRTGFVPEGRLRKAAWVNGEYLDEVLFGLLDSEWRQQLDDGPAEAVADAERIDEAGMESFPASDPPAF